MAFRVDGLSKRYHGTTVLDRVSFEVRDGELVSLVGPSGVGKTTLLRCIAGLEAPDEGRVVLDQPQSREKPVIMVFQDYLLFPNLTVFENVAFGLRSRGMRRRLVRDKVEAMLGFFHLEPQARQYPHQLSAGQKQRTAIARAMVVEPALLLLDEPFANLDPNLKLETAEFIRQTQQSFGVTTVSVTHDLSEAFVMSDRVGIVLSGRLVQYAPAGEVYHRPASLEAARFLGPVNVLSPELCAALRPPGRDCAAPLYVRPEALGLKADPEGQGLVDHVSFAGHYARYRVLVRGEALIVYGPHNGLAPGDRVQVAVRDSFSRQPDKE